MKLFFTVIILGLVIFISLDKQPQIISINHMENFVTEPKVYGKLGDIYIEISGKIARNSDNKVFVEGISTKLYGENQVVLGNLSASSGIFDIQSKIFFIKKKLLINSEKFKLESQSCKLYLDSNLVVFYKPKLEIL